MVLKSAPVSYLPKAEEAITRLEKEKEKVRDSKSLPVCAAVVAALSEFCRQEEEFAEAVLQSDKGLIGCMDAVMKGVGPNKSVLSDLEAYQRAVGYFFPGADVKFHMTVDLIGSAAAEEIPRAQVLDFDLFDLL